MRIEETPGWNNPRAIRIDVTTHANMTVMRSVDDDGRITATGPDVVTALKRYLEVLVVAYPEYGGTNRDVMMRVADAEPPEPECASG